MEELQHLKVVIYLKLIDKQDTQRKWENFKRLLAINLTNELVKVAPVDTGRLRLSIDWRTEGEDIEIYMVDYAKYVEFGTPPHIIKPRNAKALHWKSGGQDIFATKVHHPGTRPQPFIRTTFRTKLKNIVGESISEAFK